LHPRKAVRTTYDMGARAEERVELRVPAGRKAKWRRAAERAGVSLSDWARRRLDESADQELAEDEPVVPSAEDVEAALRAIGSLKGREGAELRERVHQARETPWIVKG